MTDQFCLKWTDFHSCIVNALDSLKCSEDLVDVTLTCEGQNIKAHKVILSACSPYFRGVFKENPCRHPIIILKGVLAADIVRLLAYMYQGEVQVQEAELPSFLQTAELLQVKGLTSLVPQINKHAQNTSPASVLSLHSKKISSQLMLNSKKCTCNKSSSKEAVAPSSIKPPGGPNKRRRNSTTDKVTETSMSDHPKKPKVAKDRHPVIPKTTDSALYTIDAAKLDTTVNDPLSISTHSEADKQQEENSDVASENCHILANVQVKHEIEEEMSENDPNEEIEQTASEQDSGGGSPPSMFYENSMLARSLMSGIQSLKNESSLNTTSLSKTKFGNQSSLSGGGVVPEVTLTPIHSEETQIKSERLSPHPDAAELEPEVLISEQVESQKAGRSPVNASCKTGQAARPGESPAASTSLGNFVQSNHAAICGDCPHCGTKYSNQSALKYHVRLMHSDLTNRLCCYLCPRSFTMRDTFKEHMWTSHGQRN